MQQLIRERHERLEDSVPPGAAEGSELSLDDQALAPHLLSGSIRASIAQALDHLDAHRGLMEDAQRIHVWAQYSLMRAALEAACTAVWLVVPDQPEERRFRLLRLIGRDIKDSQDAARLHGLEPKSGRTHRERLDEVKALAPAERRDEVGASLSYRRIVRAAAPAADIEPDFLELQWRILSGLTHGAQWATLAMLDRTTKPSAVDGIVHARFTGSIETLSLQALQVLRFVDIAESTFADRAAAPAGTTA